VPLERRLFSAAIQSAVSMAGSLLIHETYPSTTDSRARPRGTIPIPIDGTIAETGGARNGEKHPNHSEAKHED